MFSEKKSSEIAAGAQLARFTQPRALDHNGRLKRHEKIN
jgi:hypothetical protein